MLHSSLQLVFVAILLASVAFTESEANQEVDKSLQSKVFYSPPFYLQPGSVANKFYFDIPFPRGHIAIKSFDAEAVDEYYNSVPLHEAYLHHWVVEPYYGLKKTIIPSRADLMLFKYSNLILLRNAGICKGTLGQYFGLGSETRRTATWVPNPYGIEVGNPEKIPDKYEERWVLNVHAIDTRDVDDRVGCTECKCSLYNVTMDEFNQPLPKDYLGGLYCCYDGTRCRITKSINNLTRKFYLKYTVKWLNWVDSIMPVQIYIFDVTDKGASDGPGIKNPPHISCMVEYDIKACEGNSIGACVNTRRAKLKIPVGGDIVYGVAHQHSAGLGAALYGQDGRMLCASNPTYGEGEEVGNEAGYIVGMSTCYPERGSVKVSKGEVLTLESNYNSSQAHSGVMGLFYILVAETQPHTRTSIYAWAFILSGVILIGVAVVIYAWKRGKGISYQALILT